VFLEVVASFLLLLLLSSLLFFSFSRSPRAATFGDPFDDLDLAHACTYIFIYIHIYIYI